MTSKRWCVAGWITTPTFHAPIILEDSERDLQQLFIDILQPYVHHMVLEENPDDDTLKEEDLSDNEVYWSEVTRVMRRTLREVANNLSTEAG